MVTQKLKQNKKNNKMNQIKELLVSFNEELKKLTEEVDTLTERNNSQETTIENLKKDVSTFIEKIKMQDIKIEDLKKQLKDNSNELQKNYSQGNVSNVITEAKSSDISKKQPETNKFNVIIPLPTTNGEKFWYEYKVKKETRWGASEFFQQIPTNVTVDYESNGLLAYFESGSLCISISNFIEVNNVKNSCQSLSDFLRTKLELSNEEVNIKEVMVKTNNLEVNVSNSENRSKTKNGTRNKSNQNHSMLNDCQFQKRSSRKNNYHGVGYNNLAHYGNYHFQSNVLPNVYACNSSHTNGFYNEPIINQSNLNVLNGHNHAYLQKYPNEQEYKNYSKHNLYQNGKNMQHQAFQNGTHSSSNLMTSNVSQTNHNSAGKVSIEQID